jgi:hypothetical protein
MNETNLEQTTQNKTLSINHKMLALVAWFGASKGLEPSRLCLQVFMKIGGKFVGHINMKALATLKDYVKDLQAQVSRIFRHPTRTSNYLKLFIDNFELPSFTYDDSREAKLEAFPYLCLDGNPRTEYLWLESYEGFNANMLLARLRNVCANSRLECMYDEDDSQVLARLEREYGRGVVSKTPFIALSTVKTLMNELQVLKYTHDPCSVCIVPSGYPCIGGSLNVLSKFTNLNMVTLRHARIDSWAWAKNLPLKVLKLDTCNVVAAMTSQCFPHLERLCVRLSDNNDEACLVVDEFPKLTSITFFGSRHPRQPTQAFMLRLASMPLLVVEQEPNNYAYFE